MQHLSATFRLAATIVALLLASIGHSVQAQDINNGRQLYITPLVSGQFSCSNGQCHGPTPAANQNKIQNAANDPDRISFAISSVLQMAFLRNNVNGSQLADLAAYIGDPSGVTNAPIAQVSPGSLSFAATPVGGTSATQQVSISNTGTAALTISSIISDSAEFVLAGSCTSIAPNASCVVTVRFAPTAINARSGTLTVTHNAAGGASTVTLTGTGTAVIAQLTPAAITFPAMLLGSSSGVEVITVTNAGNLQLSISAVNSSSPEFPLAGGTCVAGGAVAPGANCTIGVRFVPTAAGSRTGQINVLHNAAGGTSAVAVSGTATSTAFEKRTMVEYIYTSLNYYFITSRDSDKAVLDTVAAFQRTGQSFTVYAAPETGTQGISRFLFDKVALNGARASHFYTLVDSEKMLLAQLNPGNTTQPKLPFNEGVDSYAFLPVVEGVGGSCAAGQVPVYRLFRGNVRFPDDPNHRFTTSTAIYNEFVALGWDGEGVKFCALAP